MGFGGAAAAMITSLKNNDRRNKREAFDGSWTGTDEKSEAIKVEPVSEELLQEIRDKLKNQRRTLFNRRLIGFGLIIALIVGCIMYLLI